MTRPRASVAPLLLKVVLVGCVSGRCLADGSSIYKLLYPGGSKIIANYTSQGSLSRVRCALKCSQLTACCVYTWDSISQECQLLEALPTSAVSLTPAGASLETYYKAGQNNRQVTLGKQNTVWRNAKPLCEAMGGRLALPIDYSCRRIIHFIFNAPQLLVGMWRQPLITGVWYDMENHVITTNMAWKPTQPNGVSTDEACIFSEYGLLVDTSCCCSLKIPFICEV
nr:uncharacterized protein LOC123772793 [Procambarus clarkii]